MTPTGVQVAACLTIHLITPTLLLLSVMTFPLFTPIKRGSIVFLFMNMIFVLHKFIKPNALFVSQMYDVVQGKVCTESLRVQSLFSVAMAVTSVSGGDAPLSFLPSSPSLLLPASTSTLGTLSYDTRQQPPQDNYLNITHNITGNGKCKLSSLKSVILKRRKSLLVTLEKIIFSIIIMIETQPFSGGVKVNSISNINTKPGRVLDI